MFFGQEQIETDPRFDDRSYAPPSMWAQVQHTLQEFRENITQQHSTNRDLQQIIESRLDAITASLEQFTIQSHPNGPRRRVRELKEGKDSSANYFRVRT